MKITCMNVLLYLICDTECKLSFRMRCLKHFSYWMCSYKCSTIFHIKILSSEFRSECTRLLSVFYTKWRSDGLALIPGCPTLFSEHLLSFPLCRRWTTSGPPISFPPFPSLYPSFPLSPLPPLPPIAEPVTATVRFGTLPGQG